MKKLTAFLLSIAMLTILPVYAKGQQDTIQEKNEAVISVSVPSFHTVTIETVGNAEAHLADSSGSSFQVERLSEPVLEIMVPDGEALTKVTVNGEDILGKIVSGRYQLPPVYENLTIVIESEPSEETTAVPRVTVYFNFGDGVILQTVGADGRLALPIPPKKKGYNFLGWYTDQACTREFDPTKPITADLILYAKWAEKTYQVTVTISGDTDAVDAAMLNLLKDNITYQKESGNSIGTFSFHNVAYGAYDLDINIRLNGKSHHHTFPVSTDDEQ